MTRKFESNPKADGYKMPGEHEAHDAIWMAWPERSDNWRNGAKPAQQTFIEVAKAISKTTPVIMAVSANQFENARAQLPSHISVVEMSANDSWMRDIGPSYVVNEQGDRRGVDWEFNAWGGLVDGLYFPWDQDDLVAQKICGIHGDDRYRAPLVLEGGSIHVDGDGTVYTTEECLLHPSRNPHMSKEEIETALCEYVNAEKVVWIPNGLFNDETNGHVDNLIHVVGPAEVVLTWCDDINDPQYDLSRESLAALEAQTDAKGRSIKVHKLPMPGPLFMTEEEANGIDTSEGMERRSGERLAASYANYLVTNGQILLPLLDPKFDGEAIRIFKEIYPQHTITGVQAREILLGGGNIHCITQQVPSKK